MTWNITAMIATLIVVTSVCVSTLMSDYFKNKR
jgi:hypothetical protein